AVKGAADKLAHEIKRVAAGVFGAGVDDIELADGQARLKANAEAAIPFMGVGAIVNANNAILPEDVRDVTLNCRYVYVPPFTLPDFERKYGNLTLTYATQIHAAIVEVDPETGVYDIVDYAAVDDSGTRRHPRRLRGAAGRTEDARRTDNLAQLQPVPRSLGTSAEPGQQGRGRGSMKVEGTRSFAASRQTVWDVLNSPEQMAKLMPGVES